MGYTNKADSNFSDVSEDKWYYNEFLIAKLQGVITGDELGNANPEAVITRNEAAVILARALKLDTTDSSTQIKDIDLIPDWAKGAVIALNNKGIINGYSDGEFKGDNTLKRGEGFSLIGNIIKQSEKQQGLLQTTLCSSPCCISDCLIIPALRRDPACRSGQHGGHDARPRRIPCSAKHPRFPVPEFHRSHRHPVPSCWCRCGAGSSWRTRSRGAGRSGHP